MRLVASLPDDDRYDELLAVVKVESDMAEDWAAPGTENLIRRTVVGTVTRLGSIWLDLFKFWALKAQLGLDGRSYLMVPGLQVDHDLYSERGHLDWRG